MRQLTYLNFVGGPMNIANVIISIFRLLYRLTQSDDVEQISSNKDEKKDKDAA